MKLTQEQLSALPERKETEVRLLSKEDAEARGGKLGDSEVVGIPPKLSRYKICGDDVILFHDEKGSWFVDYHLEGGPFKRRATL